MKLHQLRYFQCLSHYLHYRKASEALYISQPTLSFAIKELEKDVRAIKKHYWNQIMFGLIPVKIKYSFFRSFFDKTKEELSVDEGENHYFE